MSCLKKEKRSEMKYTQVAGGNHAASRTLVGKAFRTGFYWPTALKDAEELVRKCKCCQMFARQAHVPAHNLICIPPAWHFSCWGLDQVGPLKKCNPKNQRLRFNLFEVLPPSKRMMYRSIFLKNKSMLPLQAHLYTVINSQL